MALHDYAVPDLHCFEVLPEYEDISQDSTFYHPSISTEDSTNESSDHRNTACRPSSCCSIWHQADDCTTFCPAISSTDFYDDTRSYHDIWCDDLDLSSVNKDEGTYSSTFVPPDSTVPQLSTSHAEQTGDQIIPINENCTGQGDHDEPFQTQQVPSGACESKDTSDTGVVSIDDQGACDVTNVMTTSSVPEHTADTDDDNWWWELSQLSTPSQTSSYSWSHENDDDGSPRVVPALHSWLTRHSVSAGHSDDDTNNQMGERQEQREGELLFHSTCAATEQVVPKWPPEE